MTTNEIHTIYGRTIKSLDNRELKNAFDSLQSLVAHPHGYIFRDELNNLQETYKQLLYYYTAGSKDPMREKIYAELLTSVYELADKITQKALAGGDSPEMYYSLQRTSVIHAENITKLTETIRSSYDIKNIPLAETSVMKLFKSIWTSISLSEDDFNGLHHSLAANEEKNGATDSPGYMTILNCQIVSALMLGLQKFFDRRKMHLLIDAADSGDEEVKIRAYIGILIALYQYKYRIDYYPEIKYRLDNLAENPDFKKNVYLIILRFILSRETEKISHKIKDEIIPEMMKLHPKFNPEASPRDLSHDNIENEMNPEWMEKISNTPLGKKLEEFNKLQEEGADVMHSTFIHLKNFPFFNEISNWFIPFKKGQSSLSEKDIVLKSLELITNVGFMCNSDLYSLYFSIKQIPEKGRKMMIGQLESQLSELKRQKMAGLQTRNDNTERIIGQYVQDLYRFYKLHLRRNEFNDIFTQKLDFHNLPILQPHFSNKSYLFNIAEYYLRKNYFEDALTVYKHLSDTFEDDEMLFQKKGYCCQMTGDFEEAINEYAKAELINPESKWLLRHTAQCYRAVKRPEKAAGYYLHYEKLDPENLSVLLSIGSCYLEMKNYTEALRYYFKVDYLDQEGGKAWRPIAWCSFHTGKYDQARNYYDKILSQNPDYHDYMNTGHTEWALQNIKGALDLYEKSVQTAKYDFEAFRTEFSNDIPELTAAGIDVAEIPLMLDKLRYSLHHK
ncbi:MAG: tetratricopeptide repeat protein [Tannerella sp.]|jgi:tetratricopeptide (TPR) repeat protein|nr:tetratricopeptide repeat protein [Tannerella sp.]